MPECTNIPGAFKGTCQGILGTCEDIDKCAELTVTCTCNVGFYGDGYDCEDFNDCGDDDVAGIEP